MFAVSCSLVENRVVREGKEKIVGDVYLKKCSCEKNWKGTQEGCNFIFTKEHLAGFQASLDDFFVNHSSQLLC